MKSSIVKVIILAFFLSTFGCFTRTEENAVRGDDQSFLNDLERRASSFLCQDGEYLLCVNISREQCEREMSEIAPLCSQLLANSVPTIGEEENIENLGDFGEEYGACLIEKHLEMGEFDRERAENCLLTKQ